MPKPRNYLSTREIIAVCRYLEKHEDTLKGLGPATLIAAIKDGTGIAMTRANLDNLKTVDGLSWVVAPRKKAKQEPRGDGERILGEALVDIYAKLGEEVPEELAALVEEG